MGTVLAMTSGRKCPLCWMDGAILISFRKRAKYCAAPSSSAMVNESPEATLELSSDVSNTLAALHNRIIKIKNRDDTAERKT